MAEIKSTLDLVMEKTRHLTLSKVEKQKQDRLDEQKLFKGLLQRYQDDLLSLEQLKGKMLRMQKSSAENGEWMRSDVLDRIDLDMDNTHWLAILKEYFRLDCSGLESILKEYNMELNKAENQWRNNLRDTLAKTHNIKGSAVVPNIEADTHWKDEKAEIQARTRKRLDRKKLSE